MGRSFKYLTASAARKLDLYAQEKLGMPAALLMENAGSGVADEVERVFKGRRVAVFCGRGNNGGDGFVVVRHLIAKGIKTDIFLAGDKIEVRNEARLNLDILLKMQQEIKELTQGDISALRQTINKYDLIVDALLGIGARGEPKGIYRSIIEVINKSKALVLSVDIPSGLDATEGKISGCCIKADTTVTFIAKKKGMISGQGQYYCGKIIVKDLGIRLI